jgi:flagellin
MSSFRINTNTQAMSALRNLGTTGMEMSKSMTRLSTGMRINSASDDPAGLIVSESFRAQIGGIDTAIRNNQDATNYAKTAEGALNEVNKLLNDARSLAVSSGNGAVLTDSQRQANQQQLNSIIESVNRISSQTSFGDKKLLDGSSGVQAGVANSARYGGINLSGNFGGSAITGGGLVTVNVTTAAEQATVASTATFGALTSTIATATTLSVNGVSFGVNAGDSISSVLSKINNGAEQTGVTATLGTGGVLSFTSEKYGADANVTVVDSASVLFSAPATDAGVNAVAEVSIDINGATAGGLTTVTFNQGTGLDLRDTAGNSISLNTPGNATGAALAGQTSVGSATFQIGANAGQTAALSIGNFSAASLGSGAVSGKDLSNLSMLSDAGAADALKVIDKAIGQVSESRGRIGNFVRNTLETNVRSLGVQRENLAASESSIRDVDVAQEMTNYTKLQILQQSGMSMLAQANQAPQSVLSLLR